VAYVPDVDSIEFIPAYDSKGNYFELSPEIQPKEVVIVISENERLIGLSNSEKSLIECAEFRDLPPYFATSQSSFYLKKEYYDALNVCALKDSNKNTGHSSERTSVYNCDRYINYSRDNLHRMKFNSKSVYKDAKDGWFNNDLEIRVDILFGTQNGAITKVTKYFNKSQSTMKSLDWTGLDVKIVTWNKSTYGDAMLYSWMEDDAGGTSTTSLSWTSNYNGVTTTHTHSYSIPKDHYPLGESIIEWCDDTSGDGYTYNTGRMQFQINQ